MRAMDIQNRKASEATLKDALYTSPDMIKHTSGTCGARTIVKSQRDFAMPANTTNTAMKVLLAVLMVLAACSGAHGSRGVMRESPAVTRRILEKIADGANTTKPKAIVPAPGVTQCYSISDRVMTPGKLCISQLIKENVTKVVCNEFKPECVQTVQESRMVVPRGTAATNPDEFNLSVDAACKQLGYRTFGGGSVHMTGDSPAAKTMCWNGQSWSTDNWWVQLVCCN